MTTQAILKQPQGASKEDFGRVSKVIEDANHSRKGSKEALVKLLDEYPELATLGGDMAHKAENSILETATGSNVLVKETTRRQLETMRRGLTKPTDGELERLLIDRVVLCWLSLHSAEALRADKWRPSIGTEAADFWDRHVSKLNSDYLRACKTLATVRRLLRPIVAQVNIAEQQQVINNPQISSTEVQP
jgi:hypothetical protein